MKNVTLCLLVMLMGASSMHSAASGHAEGTGVARENDHFFVDVFGCLFPISTKYILRIKQENSIYTFSPVLQMDSGIPSIKRIIIQPAGAIEGIKKYGFKKLSGNAPIEHYYMKPRNDMDEHILRNDRWQITIFNEPLTTVQQQLQYCEEHPAG